jgi:hypothetical protein
MKLGILLRHAFILQKEHRRTYKAFIKCIECIETSDNLDYIKIIGLLSHKKAFKNISKSIFTCRNKARSFSYNLINVNPLDFDKQIIAPLTFSLGVYTELTKCFSGIIDIETNQINTRTKNETLTLYASINSILDTFPQSIQQIMKE